MSAQASTISAALRRLRSPATHQQPEITPMPVTPPQLADIRAVLRWVKTTKAGAETREALLIEALEAAIRTIESSPNSLAAWVIGALNASMVKRNDMWIVTNRQLHTEALDVVEFLHSRKE